jgi:flagellar basal body-associated protein FliL
MIMPLFKKEWPRAIKNEIKKQSLAITDIIRLLLSQRQSQ